MADSRRWVWWGVAFAAALFVYFLHPILTPFLVAIVLAYMFDPVVDRLEKYGFSRTWGVVTVFALFTVIFMTLLLVLVPLLAKQLLKLYQLAPLVLDWLQHTAMPWVQAKFGLSDGFWQFDKIKAAITEHVGQAGDIVGVVLSKATASSLALVGFLANLVLIPVVAFYLLRDWNILLEKIRNLLPRDSEERIVSLAKECHDVLGAFVRGQLLVMLALGVIYSAGLMLVGLELGLLIGLMAGLAAIVPYMGFIIG
ncbi:AI-2E family transporter, partial [Pseudomonas fragi]|nr:AI-2E family transporter [Pseudomonas sp. GC01]